MNSSDNGLGTHGLPRLASKRARIGDTLVAAVGAQRLEPGAVYAAAALAEALGVTPGQVTEAMISLASEGVVELVADDKFRISDPTVAELRDMIELRLLIEIPAIRKVADEGVTDGELAVLNGRAGATSKPVSGSDVLGYINADMAFHLFLLNMAGNEQLVEVVRILRSRSRLNGLRDKDSIKFMAENAGEHLELIKLVTSGEVNAADDLLRRHISRITDHWVVP